MAIQHLTPDQLKSSCDPNQFQFATTSELEPLNTIIGQPRAVRAFEFGLGIESHGYNIFVICETGKGTLASIEQFLQHHAQTRPTPNDWVYVHNFAVTHQPQAISLPAGKGGQLKSDLDTLVKSLEKELPQAFDTEAYKEAAENIRQRYKDARNTALEAFRQEANQEKMTIVNSPSGVIVAPLINGKAITDDEFQQLPVEQYQELDKKRQIWAEKLDNILYNIREQDIKARDQMNALDRDVAAATIAHYFESLRQKYLNHDDVTHYINAVYADILDNLGDFFPPDGSEDERETDLRRYEVNLLVDNGSRDQNGAPVVVELHPRYTNLLGRIEYESQTATHFTNIKAGSLHRANGGYLILNARDVLPQRDTWESFKRALMSRELSVQSPDRADGNQVLAKSLDPQPIPLDVKVVLLGSGDFFYRLYNHEEDFSQLFKVKVEFNSRMPRTAETEMAYAAYVANRCHEEKLRHFDRSAVAQLVEFGSRLCEHQCRLSTRFEIISDIIREASFWAGRNCHEFTSAADVRQALEERRTRANLDEEQSQDEIVTGTIFVTVSGSAIGQVNDLSVVDAGDYAFGLPGRITAQTFKGERGIINIDREVDMTGPIHHKGLLTLIGYLGGTYAQNQPLSLSASVSFEQSYHPLDGDSASSPELYAILSSIAELPIDQSFAVTGSVNQKGEIQPIGSVNEKIEGFYATCKSIGLTGKQGVLIPAANLPHLMVNEETITAVENDQFHIWSIETIEEGMTLLTGAKHMPPDENQQYPDESLHGRVLAGLRRLGNDDDDDDDDDAGDSEDGKENESATGS